MRFLYALLLFMTVGPQFGAAARTPVPSTESQTQALKLIREVFKADYAKMGAADKQALAEKLLKQSADPKNDPATRYALLREARDLAAKAADLTLAERMCDLLAKDFEVSLPSVRLGAYQQVPIGTELVLTQALARAALRMVETALALDEMEIAAGLQKVADGAARKIKDSALIAQATASVREIFLHRQEYDKIQSAMRALEKDPNDPAANLALGKYQCFLKGNWDRGLPLLAKSSDDKLKTLAARDLKNPRDATEQVAVGDGWYDLIKAPDNPTKIHLQVRTHTWYHKALPNLTGLSKSKVEKRLPELDKALEGRLEAGDLWLTVRDGLRANRIAETKYFGGNMSTTPFKESLPGGSLLIGFYYTLGKWQNNDIMDFMQPIYLTPTGEKVGLPYGKAKTPVQVIKAKKGYVIGGMTIRGGGSVDGFSMTFMKIEGGGLKKEDSYTSEWIGGPGGGGGKVLGDGSLIIGIHGMLGGSGKIAGLGLLYLKSDVTSSMK